jgi:thioredoxin reductase (NADPH)
MSGVQESGADSAPLLDAEDPALFPKLTEAQVALLAPLGEVRTIAVGEVLFRPGNDSYDVMVVRTGTVSVVVGSGEEERELVRQGPGDLMVELNLFTGQGTGATGIVLEPGSVLAVPAAEFRDLVGRDLSFGDFVLQTLFRRRQALERLQLGIRIIGSRFDRDTQRLREFAVRNRLLHEWVDADDPRAQRWLGDLGITEAPGGPVVLFEPARFLINPTNEELAAAAGLRAPQAAPGRTYDLAVVGGGPGGLAASVYGAAGGLSTILIDAVAVGGQAATSGRIENYLGFPAGLSGAELAERSLLQAEKFDAQISVPSRAVGLGERDGFYVVTLENGDELVAKVVVLALGVQYRRLPIEGLEHYEGNGIVYAVDVARGSLSPGAPAVVVGGANSAGQTALTLAEDGHHVFLVVRGRSLADSMARYLRDRIARHPAVDVLLGHQVRGVSGGERLEEVIVEETSSGERQTLAAGALVVLIGAQPRTEWLAGEIALDEDGFIITGPQLGTFSRGARALEDAGTRTISGGDQPTRRVRSRGRPVGIDQDGRAGGGRWGDGSAVRRRAPRSHRCKISLWAYHFAGHRSDIWGWFLWDAGEL